MKLGTMDQLRLPQVNPLHDNDSDLFVCSVCESVFS